MGDALDFDKDDNLNDLDRSAQEEQRPILLTLMAANSECESDCVTHYHNWYKSGKPAADLTDEDRDWKVLALKPGRDLPIFDTDIWKIIVTCEGAREEYEFDPADCAWDDMCGITWGRGDDCDLPNDWEWDLGGGGLDMYEVERTGMSWRDVLEGHGDDEFEITLVEKERESEQDD